MRRGQEVEVGSAQTTGPKPKKNVNLAICIMILQIYSSVVYSCQEESFKRYPSSYGADSGETKANAHHNSARSYRRGTGWLHFIA